MAVKQVISGGQTGGDMGGLRAATACSIPTGGHCPAGWRTEKGSNLLLRQYGLIQTKSRNYLVRTEKNVCNSDFTIGFGNKYSSGMKATYRFCNSHDKPFLHVTDPIRMINEEEAYQRIEEELTKHNVEILNIAGNRESTNPGLEKAVKNFLVEVFKRLDPLYTA
jgi:hypothetical protein